MSALVKLLLLCKFTTNSIADLYRDSLTRSKSNGLLVTLSVKTLSSIKFSILCGGNEELKYDWSCG